MSTETGDTKESAQLSLAQLIARRVASTSPVCE